MARGKKTTTASTKEVQPKSELEALMAEQEQPEEKKTVTVKPEVDKKDVEIDNLKAQIEQLKALVKQQSEQPKQIIVAADNSERVWFLWMADVAEDNQVLIGENGQYGRIVGKTGTFYVPKNDISRIMDSAMRYYIQNRMVIILSGLTDDEKEALGVNYKDGEILTEKEFRNVVNMGKGILDIFPGLCEQHKEMVAGMLRESYETKKNIDRETVIALNRIYPHEAFKMMLEEMNAADMNA